MGRYSSDSDEDRRKKHKSSMKRDRRSRSRERRRRLRSRDRRRSRSRSRSSSYEEYRRSRASRKDRRYSRSSSSRSYSSSSSDDERRRSRKDKKTSASRSQVSREQTKKKMKKALAKAESKDEILKRDKATKELKNLKPDKEAILRIESNEFVPQSFSSSANSRGQQDEFSYITTYDEGSVKQFLPQLQVALARCALMSDIKVISYGCGAQTLIFISSILSATVIYLTLGKYRDHVIAVLVALGAASLAGDAIFHLLPHALNTEFHHKHGGKTPDCHLVVLWRSLLIVCSVYFFYLFHLFFHFDEGGHAHAHIITPESCEGLELIPHDSEKRPKHPTSKINRALILMMMFGEVLHTASDGLAIGAAFSSSAADGLSTSIAVLFHEIPHAVGDFAIFVSSGVPVRNSLCLLSICYIFSYLGVVFGAVLGASLNLTAWIFAVIAGMFLYIALVEMIPEMFSIVSARSDDRKFFIFLQNMGLLSGFSIMMALAAFEDKLKGVLT